MPEPRLSLTRCENCGNDSLIVEKRHYGHVHMRCKICGWKTVVSEKKIEKEGRLRRTAQ
jgi:ribosomal protein S27E